ncbi:J domain-containing protein [Sulfurimonas paralvinellae]|uniref:J domain-containing protein n=1 Tax=Sulfurimonas paralvinellae TaxID=317658 RepID=A0A7M1BB41_9BACT|nr:J domain-containing protein [Sulfurimonas paralvinellae]QOP45992.1 J domain-containing protein [Sulfurimonas paralvinellae]
MKAKSLLGLREKSSIKEIKNRYKDLMKKWHPDKHPNDVDKATKMSMKINDAYKTILEYCNNYEYPFDEESIREKYQSPSEWMQNKFGNKKDTI